MRSAVSPSVFVALAAAPALSAERLAAAPRYQMVLSADKPGHGVQCISFVENPAIQRGWVALAAVSAPAEKLVHLASEAHKQVLTGPALIPGQEILRLDEQGQPYYIRFDAATIAAAARRFAKDGKHQSTNQDHSVALDGNVVEESWLVTDPKNDKAAALGLEVPAGTWMLSVHVPDADYWQAEVMSGNKTGFSIEALFDAQELQLAAVAAPKPPMKKTWLTTIMFALAAISGVKLSKVELKNGDIVDVAEDGTVSTLDADGNISGPAADGDYELADGTMLTVKDGKKAMPAAKEMDMAGEADTATAAAELQKAIDLHKQHLDGSAPTDAASQQAMMDLLEKALAALGKPAETTLAAVQLEAVPLAGGKTVNFDPMTRKLTDEAGALLPSGDYKRTDGTCFRVNTDQYCFEIPAADYKAVEEAKAATETAQTELAAVRLQLAQAQTELSRTPAGKALALGGDTTQDKTPISAAQQRLADRKARS